MLIPPLDTLFPLTGWLMVGLWAIQYWLKAPWYGIGIGGLILFTLVPILPLPLPYYFSGVAGNLSLLSWVILLWSLLQKIPSIKIKINTANPSQHPRHARFALLCLVLFGFLLELSAILPTAVTQTGEVGQWLALPDFYRWGFIHQDLDQAPTINGLVLLILALGTSLLLWYWDYLHLAWSMVVVVVITASNHIFQWSLLPSENVWDSFIDPYLLGVGALRLWKQRPTIPVMSR